MEKKEIQEKCYFPFKRTISVILAVVMAFSALSVVASAVDVKAENTEISETVKTAEKEENKQEDVLKEKSEPSEDEAGAESEAQEEKTEDEILEELKSTHYTVKIEGFEMSFRFDETGSMIVDDSDEAKKFFAAFEKSSMVNDASEPQEDGAEGNEGYKFDERYIQDDYLFTLLDFAINHSRNEKMYDKYSQSYVYGIKDVNFKDRDNNFICDDCGYCLTGCVDGDLFTYDETSDPDGIHKKSIVVEYYNEQTGKTEIQTQYYYESEYRNGDGICDNCGKKICTNKGIHEFSDGKCNTCGFCLDVHADESGDNVCDKCGICLGGHTDDDVDGSCDKCGAALVCNHADGVTAGICDTCGMCDLSDHYDANSDGLCDRCGKCCGEHTDVAENKGAGDGFCDKCKVCVNGHKDDNLDGICDICNFTTGFCTHPDKEKDGICDVCGGCISENHTNNDLDIFCDVCGKNTLICSNHIDEVQDKCMYCEAPYCAVPNTVEITQAAEWFRAALDYITDNISKFLKGTSEEIMKREFRIIEYGFYKEKLLDYELTYTGLPELKQLFESVDILLEGSADKNMKGYFATADELLNMSAEDIAANGLDISLTATITGLMTAFDSVKAKAEQKTADEDSSSTFTKDLKAYCERYCSKEKTDKVNNYIGRLGNLARSVLLVQIYNVLGKNYKNGYGIVTKENRLDMRQAANNLNYDLYDILYTSEKAILKNSGTEKFIKESADELAEKIWLQKDKKDFSSYDENERVILGVRLNDMVLNRVASLLSSSFTDFYKNKPNINTIKKTGEGNETYAVRGKMDNDLARENPGDEYYITDEAITRMIRELDNFVTSDQFLKLLGIEGYDSLYDYATDTIDKMLSDGDMLNGIINNLLSTLFPMICGMLDGGLDTTIENLMKKLLKGVGDISSKGGVITADLGDTVNFLMSDLGGLNKTLAEVISFFGIGFYGQNIELDYNGGNGTTKLRKLLHDEFGISVYPSEVGNAIASFDKDNVFTEITNTLKKAGDDWSKVKIDEFDWNINNLDSFKYAVSALLSPFSKVINFLFGVSGHEKLGLNLTKVARAKFDIVVFAIQPLFFNLPLNIEVKTGELNLYGQIIVPLFEALGINQNVEGATENLSYTMPAKLSENNGMGIINEIVDAVLALVKQIAANPVEKLLNMLPNIMFYIQEGFIPELLDIFFSFEELTVRFADASGVPAAIGTLLPSVVIIVTEIFIAPTLLTMWIPIVGKILLAAAIAMATLALGLWAALEIALIAGINLASAANKAFNVGSILSGMVSKKNLGFDINDITSILGYVLGDSPLMNIVKKINFREMGYLGNLEKMNNSSRDPRCSLKYWADPADIIFNRSLLEKGEFFYVKADLGDVVWFLTDTVVSILGDEEAFGTILDMLGLKLSDVQSIIDKLDLGKYGINISVEDTIKGLKTEDLLFVLLELIVPSDKYDLKELEWTEADSATKKEVDEHDGVIPYLEYDNLWNKELASALSEDISDSVGGILEMADGMIDLKGTLGVTDISSPGAIVRELLDKYIDPSVITQVAQLLANLKDTLGDNSDMIEMLSRLDLTQWGNDFGYLFNKSEAPKDKFLPLLTGEKSGDVIVWKYNGKEVKTSEDVINALCYLLKPAEKVLDYIFCGKDLGVVAYDKKNGVSGEVITLKGSQSYNYAIIPMLEALGIASKDIPSMKEFIKMGSCAGLANMLILIIDRVTEIADDPALIEDILEIFAQFVYMFSSGGLDVFVSDLLHPVFVLIDIIRPAFDLDVDNIINTLICKYTYTIGGYESEEEMRKVMTDRKGDFRIEDITADTLFNTVSVVLSTKVGENRLFLNVMKILRVAFNDLACLRKSYTSKAVDGEGEPMEGYLLTTDGADSLTVLISFIIEILMDGDTAKIIDGIIGMPGLVDTLTDFLWGIVIEYSNDFNRAYILGEDASKEQKEALLKEIKEKGSISVESRRTEEAQKAFDKYLETYTDTRWDKATAEYLEKYLTEMIETALNDVLDKETGDRLADTLFEGASFPKDRDITLEDVLNFFVEGYLTDETIDKIVYLVSSLLTGTLKDYKNIIYCVDGILGIDLSVFEAVGSKKSLSGDEVIYLDKDGNKTGLTRRAVKTSGDFGGALADILKPFSKVVSWLLLGDDLQFFNTSGALSDREVTGEMRSRQRRDDLICVTGSEGYKYGLVPLLEAIGCKNLFEADSYENEGVYDTDKFLEDLIGSIITWVLDIIGSGDGQSAIDNLVTILPNLFYYINSNGLTVSVNNIIAPFSYLLEIYSEKSGEDVSLSSLLGFPLDDLTFNGIFDIVESFKFEKADGSGETCSLTFNSFIRELLSSFTIGEIYYDKDSVFVYETYGMRFSDDSDRAKMLVILVSFIFDFVEDPGNKDALSSILSPEIVETVRNFFNMKDFRFEMQDLTWRFTEYKDSDVLINAITMSDLFKGEEVYGTLWTRKMAAELAENLEQFISDLLYLIGFEIDGVAVRDFRSLVHMLLGSLIFNGDTINSITSILGQIKPLLDTYDKDGYIAGFIKELLDIDLHSWDEYAPGGIYENGRDWGFITENMSEDAIDKNMVVFENALIDMLKPLAPLITWLMCEEDFTLFVEGDGLGNGEPVQLTICGAEAYAYSFVPLLEAINVDGSPKALTENLRKNNILSPDEYTKRAIEDNEYAAYGIIHPIMAKLNDVMDSTLSEVLELLPSLVYFINCNGLDTFVKNLIHAGLIILNAIEPIGRQIEMFVYDEQGINIYKTINFEGIIKDTVYGALGITEEDMVELYRSMGDEYNTVDGLEDIDFKFLFAVVVAKLNALMKDAGLDFKFTTIAGDAIKELTCGYVRGFTSLNGRQAYTMILSKDIDSQCYGDLITTLIRLVLKFLSTDNNADALMHLIQTKAKMSPVGYEIVDSLLKLLVRYMTSPNNTQMAMVAVYYTVYGISTGSDKGIEVYDKMNKSWTKVIKKLGNIDNPIASEILLMLISAADENTEGIIDSEGIASKGFYGFIKNLIELIKKLIKFIKELFK